MASKSAQQEPEKAEVIEELLDTLDTTLDRVKVLYEQYFLGIQKQPPAHLHTDVERKLRELAQMQIRNTALRYRFNTLQQKFGSYSTYWRRTLRQIENGTYLRNLSKLSRQAAITGEEIPEEILAAMPKRMREQVRRDREAALAIAKRRDQIAADGAVDELLTLAPEDDDPDSLAFIREPTDIRRKALEAPRGPYLLNEADDDFDVDAFFASVTSEDADTIRPMPAPAAPDAEGWKTPPPDFAVRITPAAEPSKPAGRRTPQAIPIIAEPEASPPAPPVAPPTPPKPVTPAPLRAATVGPPRTGIIPPIPAIPRPGQKPNPASPATPRRETGPAMPIPSPPNGFGPAPAVPRPAPGPDRDPSGPSRTIPLQVVQPGQTSAIPTGRTTPIPTTTIPRAGIAASQNTRAIPVAPGAAAKTTTPVETMSGPFPREPSARQPRARTEPGAGGIARPPQEPPQRPPPGMTDADVNALYAKYVKAKEMVGETAGPGAYGRLLKTINAQAPKIMQEYNAKGVDFSVVVKDNQVIIRAKPKS